MLFCHIFDKCTAASFGSFLYRHSCGTCLQTHKNAETMGVGSVWLCAHFAVSVVVFPCIPTWHTPGSATQGTVVAVREWVYWKHDRDNPCNSSAVF
jgi:hypothetical protein